MKKPLAVDRLPWDARGLDLRFRHYAPELLPDDRAALVAACGLTRDASEAFASILDQLRRNKRRKR